jgi:hypothetical protein
MPSNTPLHNVLLDVLTTQYYLALAVRSRSNLDNLQNLRASLQGQKTIRSLIRNEEENENSLFDSLSLISSNLNQIIFLYDSIKIKSSSSNSSEQTNNLRPLWISLSEQLKTTILYIEPNYTFSSINDQLNSRLDYIINEYSDSESNSESNSESDSESDSSEN